MFRFSKSLLKIGKISRSLSHHIHTPVNPQFKAFSSFLAPSSIYFSTNTQPQHPNITVNEVLEEKKPPKEVKLEPNSVLDKLIAENNIDELVNLFNQYDNNNSYPEADDLFRRLEASNTQFPMCLYEHGIRLYCKGGNIDRAMEIVTKMKNEKNILPTNTIYHYILHTLCFYQMYGELDHFYEELNKKYVLKDGRIQAPMIRSYREQRLWKKAWDMFESIKKYDYFMSSTAYIHLLVTLQENEQFEKSIESFQYQRNFERAVNHLHFGLYLTALCRLNKYKEIINECEKIILNENNNNNNNKRMLSYNILPSLSLACYNLNKYSVGVKCCEYILNNNNNNKSNLINEDNYLSSLISIYMNSGNRKKAQFLIDKIITSKKQIELVRNKTLKLILLFYLNEEKEDMIEIFKLLISIKTNIDPNALNPFLYELINSKRYNDIKTIYEIIRSVSFTAYDSSLSYIVHALRELNEIKLINEIYLLHSTNTSNASLLDQLAESYLKFGDKKRSLILYSKYFLKCRINSYNSDSLINTIHLCCDLDESELLKDILDVYMSKIDYKSDNKDCHNNSNIDKKCIEEAITVFETKFPDNVMKEKLKSLVVN